VARVPAWIRGVNARFRSGTRSVPSDPPRRVITLGPSFLKVFRFALGWLNVPARVAAFFRRRSFSAAEDSGARAVELPVILRNDLRPPVVPFTRPWISTILLAIARTSLHLQVMRKDHAVNGHKRKSSQKSRKMNSSRALFDPYYRAGHALDLAYMLFSFHEGETSDQGHGLIGARSRTSSGNLLRAAFQKSVCRVERESECSMRRADLARSDE